MALYLGQNKIAGNSTDSRIGDTLPVGAIIEYDGTEVPENWELVEGGESGEALTTVPNATATTVGGIKVRLDGSVLYITTDGSDA